MKPLTCLAVWLLVTGVSAANEMQPNMIWISCEDISAHLGCYGDPHAITPHLDQLASEGVRYTHAFTAAGVCAPCRSTIITGMYQNSIGTHHMRCNATLPEVAQAVPDGASRSGVLLHQQQQNRLPVQESVARRNLGRVERESALEEPVLRRTTLLCSL